VSILDRYLVREILLPFLAGLVFLTQVLLATQILTQADVLFGSGVSAWDILIVVVSLIPRLLDRVFPVALLLGAVLGLGRWADDRELMALSAAGISPLRLVRVPIVLGLAVTALALWVGLDLTPRGLRSARLEVNEIIKKNVTHDVRAGVFYEEIPDWTVYAGEVSEGRWKHVLISDRSDPSAPLLVLARSGRLEPLETGEAMRLVLEDGELHREPRGTDEYVLGRFRSATFTMGVGGTISERNRLIGSPYEAGPRRILELIRENATSNPANALRWECFLYRRIAEPLGILMFALLAVPLGTIRRGGRAFGYLSTLLTVIVYYALGRYGEGLSRREVLPPWLGPNLPNLAVLVVAIALVWLTIRRGAGAVR
jgi:lipopolysaccharide export system permease protein